MLIEHPSHDEVMFGYVLIALLVLIGPLAVLVGVDSRIDEHARRHRFSD